MESFQLLLEMPPIGETVTCEKVKKALWRATLIGLAPVLLVNTAVAQAGTYAVPGWRVFDTTSMKTGEVWQAGVVAVSPSDAWAFGRKITPSNSQDDSVQIIKHWNGHKWRFVTLTGPAAQPSVDFGEIATAAVSSSDVWAFTRDSWMHWNGKTWTSGKMPAVGSLQEEIAGVAIVSQNDIWVVGGLAAASPSPYIAHYDGRKWTASTLSTFASLTAVSATGPKDVWAVGNGSPNVLLHFNGKSWKTFPVPARIAQFGLFTGVITPPGGGIWVTGDVSAVNNSLSGGAMHWNGKSWSVYNLTSKASVFAAASDGHGGLWAVIEDGSAVKPRFWHFTGGRWFGSSATGSAAAGDFIYDLSPVPKSQSMWAAGLVLDSGRPAGTILLHGSIPVSNNGG